MRKFAIRAGKPGVSRVQSGFTLVEVMIGVVMLGLIGTAVASISITGVTAVTDDNTERQQDALSAQWVAQVFARDVQGAGSIGDECAAGDGVHLVSLVESGDPTMVVEYRRSADAPYSLFRVVCGSTPRQIIDELEDPPLVICPTGADPDATCAPGSRPRTVELSVSRTQSFGYELDGVRRTVDLAEQNVPDDELLDSPEFVALGGVGGPLRIQNGTLIVEGDALINAPNSGPAVIKTGGSGTFEVTGRFGIQAGLPDSQACENCPGSVMGKLERFPQRLPDPLAFLPAPDTSAMVVRTDCPVQSDPVAGDRRVCSPGIYDVEFPPAGPGVGGTKRFELQPGIYVLRGGMDLRGNDELSGDGVTFYNEQGSMVQRGTSSLEVTAPAGGTYDGILIFQARTNTTGAINITGDPQLVVLGGTIYAPNSQGGVNLGAGNATMRIGRVIGTSLSVQNGTVIVSGS